MIAEPWGPAHAVEQLDTGRYRPREPQHPRINRAMAAIRDPAQTAGPDPSRWDAATRDRVTILAAHYGVPETFFHDANVAVDIIEEHGLAARLPELGVTGTFICPPRILRTHGPHRSKRRDLIRTLVEHAAELRERSSPSESDRQPSGATPNSPS